MSVTYSQAKLGDKHAVGELVEALRPRIGRMAAYYARCTGEESEDLLQEAWVGLLEALPSADLSIGSTEQYLIQRARWRLLDAVKRARIRRCVPLPETQSGAPCPRLAGTVESVWLSAFISNLNETQRAILQCLTTGMTWRETGDRLGFTSANVAYHVRRIRAEYERWNDEAARN
jgi:RNA polymerase sigma factor (sigma-70 family)